MKLFANLTHPAARKVRVVLAEKQIVHALEIVDADDTGMEATDANPLGALPLLVLDDGTPLSGAHVIVEYLDSISPRKRLLPAEMRPRIEVKRWEALADGIGQAAVTLYLERSRARTQQHPDVLRRHHGRIVQGLRVTARELGGNKWCLGDPRTYDLADLALGCTLDYVQQRFPQINWQEVYPNLAQLYLRLMALHSFAETAWPGVTG
jgi:glutathione S-transferase